MGKKIAAFALLLAAQSLTAQAKNAPTVRISFPPKNSIRAELALTPAEQEHGLMFRTSLKDGRGMLFVFPEQELRTFWMKNTLIDLDIVFIGPDKTVTSVYDKVPRSTKITPDDQVATVKGIGSFVLELPGGYCQKHGLKHGTELNFTLPAGAGK